MGDDYREGRGEGRRRRRHGVPGDQRVLRGQRRDPPARPRRVAALDYEPTPPRARFHRPHEHHRRDRPLLHPPSVIERLRGVSRALAARGLPADPLRRRAAEQLDEFFRSPIGRVDGSALISLAPSPRDGAAARGGVPVALVDRGHGSLPPSVDDGEGGRLATAHLIELGHRRIGFLGDDRGRAPGASGAAPGAGRLPAALADAGIPSAGAGQAAPARPRHAHRAATTLLALPTRRPPSSRAPTPRRSPCSTSSGARGRVPDTSRSSGSTTSRPATRA